MSIAPASHASHATSATHGGHKAQGAQNRSIADTAGGQEGGAADAFAALLQAMSDGVAEVAAEPAAPQGAAPDELAATTQEAPATPPLSLPDAIAALVTPPASLPVPTVAAEAPADAPAPVAARQPGAHGVAAAAVHADAAATSAAPAVATASPLAAGPSTPDAAAQPVAAQAAPAARPHAAASPAATTDTPTPATPAQPEPGTFAAAMAQVQPAAERASASAAREEPALHGLESPSGVMHTQHAAAPAFNGAAPASPVHQAALPTHPLDAAFGGDIAAEVKVMIEAGVQHAEVHLNPADLGPIRIQLSLTAQSADISFAAAHSATREGLAQSLPALREMLAGQGLSLGQAGVSSGGQESAFQSPQRGQEAPRDSVRGGDLSSSGTRVSTAAAPLTVRAARGMLDLYA